MSSSRYPDYIEFKAGDAPPPDSNEGYVRVYAAEDASLHVLQSDGTDTQIGAGGGGITSPLSLTGCILWLDASTLDLDDDEPVATWPDGSSSGFDATQSDPDSRPVCKTDAQNGLRVVRFDSQGTTVPQWLDLTGDGLSLLNGLDAASVIVCASTQATGGQIFAVLTNSGNARRFSIEYQANTDAISDVTLRASNDDSIDGEMIASMGSGAAPIVRTTASAATASVATNEAATQTSAPVWDETSGVGDNPLTTPGAFPNTDAAQVHVGGANTEPGTSTYDGDIFEIAVYNRALTARERRELIEYLSDKWATL